MKPKGLEAALDHIAELERQLAERGEAVAWRWGGYAGPQVQEWQPIETAPKDGKRVLIKADSTFVAGWGEVIGLDGVYGWLVVNDYWCPDHMATHWMPLPEAPQSGVKP